jgi:hypothetical protein
MLSERYRQSYLKRIIKSIADRGVIKTLRLVYSEHYLKLKYGITATGVTELSELNDIESSNKSHGIRCESSNYFICKALFRYLSSQMDISACVCIDFGSGKGIAIIYLAEFGCKQIVGVEFSEHLIANANRNIEKYRKKTGNSFQTEIIHTDATLYTIPEQVNVFYFCHPFSDDAVMTRVLTNIEDSLVRKPRKIWIVYLNAIQKNVFISFGYKPEYAIHENAIALWEKNGSYVFTK